MMKKEKKIVLTTLTMLFSFALLAGGAGCKKEKEPEPTVEYTFTVSQETLTLNLFEEAEVGAIAKQDGAIVKDAKIEWSSSADSVATVSDGLVEAVSCGNAEITATWEGKTATCSVVVEDDGSKPILQVSEAEIGLQLLMTDAPYKVRPNVFFKDENHNTSSATFTYSIAENEQSVATVNAEGYVTPVGVGTATLTVSAEWKGYSEGMKKDVEITVANHVQTSIVSDVTNLSLFNGTIGGQSYSNTTTYTGAVQLNGEAVENTELVWHSTNESVATVVDGVVTALTEGETQIYYTYNDGEKDYLSDYVKVRTFPVQLALAESLGEIVLIRNASAVATDYVLDYDAFDAQASTVTKAITANGAQLSASYDKTNKQLILSNADVQENITEQEGGEYDLTIYTQENVYYDVKVMIISREITTKAGLTAFFNSYTEGATEDSESNVTYGTYVTLGADIEDFTRNKAIQTDLTTFFKGTFDGRGHAIKIDQSEEMWYKWGFFGHDIGTGAVVKNTAFIGLLKNSSSGGGLARVLAGTVDNCYVELTMNGSDNAQGGICFKNAGTITNTIVNVTSSASTDTSNKATLCNTGAAGSNTDFKTCFSIGIEGKVVFSASAAEKTDNLAFNADALKTLIGTALPTSYNSYWTYTTSGLSFGTTQVLAFTVE